MVATVVAELAVVCATPSVKGFELSVVHVFHVEVCGLFEVYHIGCLVLVDERVGITEVLYGCDQIGIGGCAILNGWCFVPVECSVLDTVNSERLALVEGIQSPDHTGNLLGVFRKSGCGVACDTCTDGLA